MFICSSPNMFLLRCLCPWWEMTNRVSWSSTTSLSSSRRAADCLNLWDVLKRSANMLHIWIYHCVVNGYFLHSAAWHCNNTFDPHRSHLDHSLLLFPFISLRCTRSWRNAGTSTLSRVHLSRSSLWASTCSGTVRSCKRKKESPKVPCSSSAEVDG